MAERSNAKGTWYSHQTNDAKYPKGWCNGKEPKKNNDELIEQIAKDVAFMKDNLMLWMQKGTLSKKPESYKKDDYDDVNKELTGIDYGYKQG